MLAVFSLCVDTQKKHFPSKSHFGCIPSTEKIAMFTYNLLYYSILLFFLSLSHTPKYDTYY